MTTIAAYLAAAKLTPDQVRRLDALMFRTTSALAARSCTGAGDTFRVSPAHIERLHRTTDLHLAIGDRLDQEHTP